ncbi:MAG: DUF6530 family protein [Alphaproteobacteria bacterium]
MKIPATLKHKPVVVSEDYDNIDGRRAGATDAKGLTLGLAQWNDRGNVEISAKVWRHTGEKWSRQSEELPLHRVLDLAILICRSKLYFKDAYRIDGLYDKESPEIERLGLQGDAMNVAICTDNPMIDADIQLFADVLGKDDELISERLTMLSMLLNRLKNS